MNYVINNEFCFDLFDDGDVIVSSVTEPKSFLLNRTTWFATQLFTDSTPFNDAKQKFIARYNEDKIFFDLIDQCKKNNISEIIISGGEPFLHPNIVDIIKYANNKHIHVRIISNLTMVSLEIAIEILRHGNFFS